MKHRSPYSLVNVKRVDVRRLLERWSGQRCVVGVDVGKLELAACVYGVDRQFDRPWRVRLPEQLGLLVEMLVSLGKQASLTVAMESSGTYGDVLRQALADARMELQRVSSKAVKDHGETFDGVPSKHDGKDAAVIAELCWRGHSRLWAWPGRREDEPELRYWVRKLDTAQRVKQVFGGKLEALLARHWPEVGGLLEQSGATLVRALARWGDPRKLAQDPQTAGVLRGFGGHYLTDQKISQVIASARSTIGVRMNAWDVRELQDVAEAIVDQRRVIQGCKRRLKELTRDHPVIQAQAPAVGLVTACVLWMCLGDVRNYDSAAAYRKAMGLNLKERSSGKHKGKLSLSKRGQRLSRKWLYFSALRWARDPRVKRWVLRKKQRDSGEGGKAIVGVMRRLALAAYHVGKHGVAFDPGRLFPATFKEPLEV